jgi:CDP-diacylglycerol--glycerol-3-phosphate 3-phosphatidyltransferase
VGVSGVAGDGRGAGSDLMRTGTEQQQPPATEPGPPPPGGARRKRSGAERLEALRDRLVASRLTPNQISMAGFVLNVIAAVLVWQSEFFLGGVVFIIGSICDTLDGGYSRMSGKGTPFGAFLDSTLDRIVEGIVLTAVAATFARRGDEFAVAAVVVAVMASLVVSYTRARAEALGVECKVGIANRLVRVIILSAGLVFADLGALEPAVYVLAALSSFTVVQRILHVRRELVQPASM